MVSISSRTSLYDGGTDVPPPPPPSVQPQSVQREPETGYSPNFPSSSSEASVTIKSGGVSFQTTVNPDEGSIKTTGSVPLTPSVDHQWKSESTKKPDLLGVEHELNINAVAEYSEASGKVIKNGQAEFTIEKTFIAKIEAGSTLSIDKTNTEITLDNSAGEGVRIRYKVSLPNPEATHEQAMAIDPFSPASIPVGATVTMDTQMLAQLDSKFSIMQGPFEDTDAVLKKAAQEEPKQQPKEKIKDGAQKPEQSQTPTQDAQGAAEADEKVEVQFPKIMPKVGLVGTTQHIEAKGQTFSITRTDENTLHVISGDTNALETLNAVGGAVGVSAEGGVGEATISAEAQARMLLGKQPAVGLSKLTVADMQLSETDPGSYLTFLYNGQINPSAHGISNVATIHRLDASTQARLQLAVEAEVNMQVPWGDKSEEFGIELGVDLAGPKVGWNKVWVDYPDGSTTLVMNYERSSNVPYQLTRKFDSNGVEMLSERRYEYVIDTSQEGANTAASVQNQVYQADLLNIAFTGSELKGPAVAGKTVTVSFTQDQMRDLQRQVLIEAGGMQDANGYDLLDAYTGRENGGISPEEFAIWLADNNASTAQFGFTQVLLAA